MTEKRKEVIDISYNKLVEALIDRHIVPSNWLNELQNIRKEITILYSDISSFENSKIQQYLQNISKDEECIYFDCQYIFQSLLETPEGKGRNIFGQYTNEMVKKWSNVMYLYEKKNIFAIEIARILKQYTNYEIPILQKSIQNADKQIEENNRKIFDLRKSIAENKKKLAVACTEIGIKGLSFREELQVLPLQLPSIFTTIALAIRSSDILTALEYHEALEKYLVGTTDFVSGKYFKAIRELQNATLDENVLKPIKKEATMEDKPIENTINWDIATIDTNSNSEDNGIAWEITSTDISTNNEMEWDISTESIGEEMHTSNDITCIELLFQREFREDLLNDMRELDAFLQMRKKEVLNLDKDIASQQAFIGVTAKSVMLEKYNITTIEQLISAVSNILDQLIDNRLAQLLLMQHSETYLNRNVHRFELMVCQLQKVERDIRLLEEKSREQSKIREEAIPKSASVIARTKRLKTQLEESLKPLFKGHKVNISGQINNL